MLNHIDLRQNQLVKNTLVISKYAHGKSLLVALNKDSIYHPYYKYKILFIKQIRKNELTFELYKHLSIFYVINRNIPLESFFCILDNIFSKMDYEYDYSELLSSNINHLVYKKFHKIEDDGLISSIRIIFNRLKCY